MVKTQAQLEPDLGLDLQGFLLLGGDSDVSRNIGKGSELIDTGRRRPHQTQRCLRPLANGRGENAGQHGVAAIGGAENGFCPILRGTTLPMCFQVCQCIAIHFARVPDHPLIKAAGAELKRVAASVQNKRRACVKKSLKWLFAPSEPAGRPPVPI